MVQSYAPDFTLYKNKKTSNAPPRRTHAADSSEHVHVHQICSVAIPPLLPGSSGLGHCQTMSTFDQMLQFTNDEPIVGGTVFICGGATTNKNGKSGMATRDKLSYSLKFSRGLKISRFSDFSFKKKFS